VTNFAEYIVPVPNPTNTGKYYVGKIRFTHQCVMLMMLTYADDVFSKHMFTYVYHMMFTYVYHMVCLVVLNTHVDVFG